MADESELSRFREQWKEEVTKKVAQGPPRPRTQVSFSSSSSVSTAQQKPCKPKRPSFSHHTRVSSQTLDEDEENSIDDDTTPNRPRVHSPPTEAVRRPSIAAATAPIAGAPRSALEHYEKAVQKESEGNLGESLKLYRKAFRLDERVDKSYREKHHPRPPPGTETDSWKTGESAVTGSGKAEVSQHSQAPVVLAVVNELIASFHGLRIEAVPKPTLTQIQDEVEDDDSKEKKFSLLAQLPSEVLLQILRHLALTDIAAFASLAQTCKSLCYIVSTEEQIWKAVCESTYSKLIWDWKVDVTGHPIIHERLGLGLLDPAPIGGGGGPSSEGDEDEDEVRRVPTEEEEVSLFGGWRDMFHLRPRIRFNGVYISTCNYHRPGGHTGTSLSWGTPIHIVTYYRYLRFYPDGTILSLLAHHEPSKVVYSFSKPSLTPAHLGGLPVGSSSSLGSWGKDVIRGRWRMDPEGRVDIETEASKRYLYRMQLRTKNVRGGGSLRGSSKLNWEGFWSWNKLTDDLALFEGRNDKPFFFSRVSAIEKEMSFI